MSKIKTVKTVRKGSQVYNWVTSAINTHEKYRNCYFWSTPTNASQRRKEEFDEGFVFILNGVKWEIDQSLYISCNNYYYTMRIYVDGQKKNITALKKLVR
jgi:hypothetical protein